jgi:hypothetical protein
MRSDAMTICAATSADTDAVRRLAASTSRPRPRGPLLVAEHDGEMVAAIAVSSGAVIADLDRPAAVGVVGDLRRRRYELLRLNGGTAEARVLMRRLTATALAA